ncbi:MAG: hypothetical protein KAJ14_05475, partial [Candidatus Omnitrophica bacterium]|nr:hypothetical protein [Candidatus Omnitrophota bacterium]
MIKEETLYDKAVKTIFELLDDDNLQIRLAAVVGLVSIVDADKPCEIKAIKFRKNIWDKWDDKKQEGEIDDFGPIYAWVLYRLGEDKEKIKQAIKKESSLQDVFDECVVGPDTDKASTIIKVIMLLLYSFGDEATKQYSIKQIVNNKEFMKEYGYRIEILDYLSEEIDEEERIKFQSIINALFEMLNENKDDYSLQSSYVYLLSKIYEKVNKGKNEQAKQLICERISSLPSEIQLAVLPEETLISVNIEFLNNDETSAEYIERLFSYLEKYIKENLISLGSYQKASLDIDYARLNEADYIEKVIEQIEHLRSEDTEELEELIDILSQLKDIVEEEGIRNIKIDSVNYAKTWQEYHEAVISENKETIKQTYQQLISEIKAGNTLEIIKPIQELYLYILSRKIRLTEEERKYRGEILGKRFRVKEITKEISNKLQSLKIDVIERIDEALSKELEDKEEQILKRVKQIIEKEDFLRPLRAHTDDKERELFDYNEQMAEAERILNVKVSASFKHLREAAINELREIGSDSIQESLKSENFGRIIRIIAPAISETDKVDKNDGLDGGIADDLIIREDAQRLLDLMKENESSLTEYFETIAKFFVLRERRGKFKVRERSFELSAMILLFGLKSGLNRQKHFVDLGMSEGKVKEAIGHLKERGLIRIEPLEGRQNIVLTKRVMSVFDELLPYNLLEKFGVLNDFFARIGFSYINIWAESPEQAKSINNQTQLMFDFFNRVMTIEKFTVEMGVFYNEFDTVSVGFMRKKPKGRQLLGLFKRNNKMFWRYNNWKQMCK